MFRYYLLTLLFAGLLFGSTSVLQAQPCPALPTVLIDTVACEGSILDLNAIAGGIDPSIVWHDQDGNDYPDGANVLLNSNGSCDPVTLSFNNLYINEDGCEIMSHVIEVITYPAIGIIETSENDCSVDITVSCSNFDVQWQDLQGNSGAGTHYDSSDPIGSIVTFTITNPVAAGTECEGISLDYQLECSLFPCDPIPPLFIETSACTGDAINLNEIGAGTQGTTWYDLNTELPVEDPTAVPLVATGCDPVMYNFYAPYTDACTGNINRDNVFVYVYPAPTAVQADALCGAAVTQDCPSFQATWADDNGQSGVGFNYTASTGQSGMVSFTIINSGSPLDCGQVVLDVAYNCPIDGCLADAGNVTGDIFVCNNTDIGQAKFLTTGTSPIGYEYTILLTNGGQILQIGTPITESSDTHDVMLDFSNMVGGTNYCLQSISYPAGNLPAGLAVGNLVDNLSGDCFDIGPCKSIEIFDCLSIALTTDVQGEVLAFDDGGEPIAPADPLAGLSITANPEHGTVELQDDGDIVYIPDEGYIGADEFILFYTDLSGQQYGLFVAVDVVSASGVCEIEPIVVCTAPQTPIDICLTCIQNEVFILNIYQPIFPCSLEITAGCVNYTPLPGMELYSPDSLVITYCSTEDPADCLTTYALINIGNCAPQNNPPVANNDAATSNGTPVNISVLGNDSDPDGDALTIGNYTQPAHGTVVLNGNSFTYTPDSGYEGSDSFTYQICDPDGLCDQATVTINVDLPDPVNNPPVANNDDATYSGSPITINVMNNDSDPDGDALTIGNYTQPAHGTVVLNGNSFTYTPDPGYEGLDSFTYQVCDPDGLCDQATVTINVTNNSLPPCNEPDNLCVGVFPDFMSFCLEFCNLSGDITVEAFHTTFDCSLELLDDNCIQYTPLPGFSGDDVVQVVACNTVGECDTIFVNVNVGNCGGTPNNPPIANNDAANSNGTPVNISVLGNDSDPDGDSITIGNYTQPAHGTVVLNGNSFTYTPDPGYEGSDSFTYQVCDPDGLCDQATVTINVNLPDPVNNAPIANNDSANSNGGPVGINVTNNDNDPDGDALTVTTYTQPAHGTVVLNGNSFTYTPDPGYEGSDSFTYQVCDPDGLCDQATVTINVDLPDDDCESITYICTSAATPEPICPEFCNLPAGTDYYIALGITNYNCLLSLAGNGDCLQYEALPLFSGQEHLMVVACTMLGICDTAHVYIQVNGCDDGGFAPTYPGEGKHIYDFTKNQPNALTFNAAVWPQPAQTYCNISFMSPDNGNLSLRLFDMVGRKIQQTEFEAQEGQNTLTLNTADLSAGVYIVELSNGQTTITAKFVK